VGISADAIADLQPLQSKLGPGVTLLTDPGAKVAGAWGHARGEDPQPATYVIDRGGVVRFLHVPGGGKGDWPRLAEVLGAIAALP
jgi:peroxiredoxin